MKTILVPVDFSNHSEYALEVAAFLAKKHDAEIVILHMMGLHESFLNKDEKDEVINAIHFMKLTKQRFDKLLQNDYLKGIDIIQAVKSHKGIAEINEVAEEYEADLIIMGSHGTAGLKEIFVGSNTEKVVRTAKLPVLVIKKRMKEFNIKKAVFVTDFDLETLNSFIRARKFLKLFEIEPKVLFINVPEKFMSTKEMKVLGANFLTDTSMNKEERNSSIIFYDDYTTEKGVFNYCHDANIDLIAIPTHGRKGIAHFFYGSTGEDIANHSNIPVITFKI